MEVLNAQEAYTYLDGLSDDRERSAAIAIHLSFMRNYWELPEPERMMADAPTDLLLLYRAAVAAFRDPPVSGAEEHSPTAAKVVNRDQAQQRLATLSDGPLLRYATRFVAEVIKQSEESPCEQDLRFLLDLFLMTVETCTPERIESGEISKHSRRLSEDPDYW